MKTSIGGLWLRSAKDGTKFFSGNIDIDGAKIDIVIFRNDKGDNPKRPDYRIFKSEPRQQAAQPATEPDSEPAPF